MEALTSYLAALGGVSVIVAALITGLQAKTTLSKRVVAVLSIALGPVVAMLMHYSGFLELAADEPRNTILSAVWGLVASLAGAGLTNANLLHAIAPPKEV